MRRRLRRLTGHDVLWSPALEPLEKGVLVSLRGGDLVETLGVDYSIGYEHHDHETVHCHITASFSFEVLEPAAVIAMS